MGKGGSNPGADGYAAFGAGVWWQKAAEGVREDDALCVGPREDILIDSTKLRVNAERLDVELLPVSPRRYGRWPFATGSSKAAGDVATGISIGEIQAMSDTMHSAGAH
jgi:hypothetical protein